MSKLDKIEELQNTLKQDQTNFQARRELAVLLLDCGFPEDAKQHFLYLKSLTMTAEFSIILELHTKNSKSLIKLKMLIKKQ